MNAETRRKIYQLTDMLNKASEKYYNGIEESDMSDAEWDCRLAELQKLENESGFSCSNSPTKRVGAPVLDKINKVKLDIPMLSLNKCHNAEEVIKFANGHPLIASAKLDGLSVRIIYKDRKLFSANTRGNGEEGSDISEHIKYFENVPLTIDKEGTYIIDGEAIIAESDFNKINNTLSDEEKYANSRNLAAGTLSLLDMNIVKQRHIKFIAWDVIEGDGCNSLFNRLCNVAYLGFESVPFGFVDKNNVDEIQLHIKKLYEIADVYGFPLDGVVFKLDDIEYGKSLGRTSHHFNNGIAWKPENNGAHTILRDIEWSLGKTGQITPVAIFDSVEIDGTMVERASLHNISICKNFELGIGDEIVVVKSNMIIPQVSDNITRSGFKDVPYQCPVCGKLTDIEKQNDSEVLICTNPYCKGKLLGRLKHFVSREAINIDGMSEATIQFLIDKGWVTKFADIFTLEKHKSEWMLCEGFGKKSVEKLLENIGKSRYTTLSRFLYGLSIPLCGKTACKTIASYFDDMASQNEEYYDNPFDCFMDPFINNVDYTYWTKFTDFGEKMAHSISSYMSEHIQDVVVLASNFAFESAISSTAQSAKNEKIAEKVFVITGSLEHFKNRDELVKVITDYGGRVSGSISAKTAYLINNDISSTSGKNKKAKELGIPIISEDEFVAMYEE